MTPAPSIIRPKTQVATMAGFMMTRSSFRSISFSVLAQLASGASLLGMVDEEARQIEYARHPGDHRSNVQRLDPKIGIGQPILYGAHFRITREPPGSAPRHDADPPLA